MGSGGVVAVMTVLMAAGAPASPDPLSAQRLVALLQYLEGDYAAAVSSGDAQELAEQRGLADEALEAHESLGDMAAELRPALLSIRARIEKAEDPTGVAADCGLVANRIADLAHLQRAPAQPPNMQHAQALWSNNCAACHGLRGDGVSAVSATMKPPPANFHDPERMATMTPYKAANTVAFGITGTAMPAFRALSEAERWELGFYVFTLRHRRCDAAPPRVSLAELASSTDAQLGAKYGDEQVACLRARLPDGDEGQSLAVALAGIDVALAKYRGGDKAGARRAVVDAYLNGLEPVEPQLRARSPGRVAALERAFTQTRLAAQGDGHFESEAAKLKELLAVRDVNERGDFWSVLIATVLILLREGFEAMVVVGALLAVLKKVGATAQTRVVHLGWLSALAAGAMAFALGHQLLSGAHRELLETFVAFAAVAMLLYAALWLNARANTSRFMGELRGQMKGALDSGSSAGLFVIAFTAVGRESFETALFLQGLASDSFQGVLAGSAAGALALGALVLMISRIGFRLPMKTLFNASTVVLVVTAVALLGQGIHGLQELGALPLWPVPFVELSVLGVYPDGWSLLAQLVLALCPLGWWWSRRDKLRATADAL